jgi:hypothetical protein
MRRARILVIANETVEGRVLHDVIWARANTADADVLVVAPALNSRLRHWLSDEDGARRAAEQRLAAAGVRAEGVVGDADPLQALTDALAWFGADEVVISTHPETRSHWLARGLVERARARFDLPILHVVAAADVEHLTAA